MVPTIKPADFLDLWLLGRRATVGLLIAIIGVGLVPRTCRSELIYFHKGGEAQLPVRLEGDRIIVAMPDGDIALARDKIRKIVPGFWPATEWETRRRQARAGGSDERFAAPDRGRSRSVGVE